MEESITHEILTTILFGINPKPNKPLFPITHHIVGKIFDSNKVKSFISLPGNLITETYTSSETIEGKSFKELAYDYANKMSVKGDEKLGIACFSWC